MHEPTVNDNTTPNDVTYARLMHRIRKRFHKGISTYGLITDNDHILVGLSGGKDSLALVALLAEKMRIHRPNFRVTAAHIIMQNIPYESDLDYLRKFCNQRNIPFVVRTTSFDWQECNKKSACFLCSWNRRKMLFSLAQELGCQKIALGHHMDDILQTLLMNECFQGSFSSMPPLLRMQKFDLSIIRPLCMVHEVDLIELATYEGYHKQNKNCPHEAATNRQQMRRIFNELERLNPEFRYSLWHSMHNVLTDYLPHIKK